jgi:hypothetical protein
VSVGGLSYTATARAAYNLHTEGDLIPGDGPPDQITLPLWE